MQLTCSSWMHAPSIGAASSGAGLFKQWGRLLSAAVGAENRCNLLLQLPDWRHTPPTPCLRYSNRSSRLDSKNTKWWQIVNATRSVKTHNLSNLIFTPQLQGLKNRHTSKSPAKRTLQAKQSAASCRGISS